MEVQRVHVVFKTHLDVGFTDHARSVIQRYERDFIPRAIRLAAQCERSEGRKRFIWTTGSFLIDHYWRNADVGAREELEQAIRRGDIAWHGLPFSMHSELLDVGLFRHGLSLAKRLDLQFDRTTIAAKMTDVPGHSIAIVPLLAEAGIRYLHLGVNPASPRPQVPRLFVWHARGGAEIVVDYSDGYGKDSLVTASGAVLVFAHSGDNQGPPRMPSIQDIYRRLEHKYPRADVFASTLDAFAQEVWTSRETLPMVSEEIGDTWIHGAASDPKKVAEFRELLRWRRRWLDDGVRDSDLQAFSDELLMVPEHTWGADHKRFLSDYRHYSKQEFQAARAANRVGPEAIPAKYGYLGAYVLKSCGRLRSRDSDQDGKGTATRSYRFLEASWQEQRNYLSEAIATLTDERQDEVAGGLRSLAPRRSQAANLSTLGIQEEHGLGQFVVRFGDDGAIHSLHDVGGRSWASERCPMALFSYETFGPEDYQRWFREYVRRGKPTDHWVEGDFGKPGLELSEPVPQRALFFLQGVMARVERSARADRVLVHGVLPDEAMEVYGGPKGVELEFHFLHAAPRIEISLQWFSKDAVRTPEASWMSFGFAVANPGGWLMHKLGDLIDPLKVVRGGNRALHALDRGMIYQAADGCVRVDTLDAPVLSLGERQLLSFSQDLPDLAGGMHFNLHNNVWGTNFAGWYEDDAKFRFEVTLENQLR